jgi:nucleoside-diphosphate-sugar epimerase
MTGGRLLVTGASGFIGAHLTRRLAGAGAEVHAVSRTPQPAADRGVRWWQGDLADLEVVRRLLRTIRPDVVYHLASHVAGIRGVELVLPTFRSNLSSTVNLLTAAVEGGGCRVVLTGSLEEPDGLDAESAPCSPYAAAKWAAGAYARMFHALYGLPVGTLRLFMVYGPAQRDLQKLVPYVTLSLLRGEAPQLSRGTREVDWVFVDDVVEALLAAGSCAGLAGKAVDVGSGQLVAIRAVVEQLVEIVNPRIAPEFGALPERPLERVRRADVEAAAAVLGWRPRTGLRAGLEATVAWYRRALAEGRLG